jgi:hypothetical protein
MQCQQNQIRCSDISQALGRRGTTVLGAVPIAGPPFATYHFVLSGMARERKRMYSPRFSKFENVHSCYNLSHILVLVQ